MDKMQIKPGMVFGRLRVKKFEHINEQYHAYWRCVCECKKILIVRGVKLTNGEVTSCGCGIKKTEKMGNREKRDKKHKEYFPRNPFCIHYSGCLDRAVEKKKRLCCRKCPLWKSPNRDKVDNYAWRNPGTNRF